MIDNLLAGEERAKFQWINEPEFWQVTEDGGVVIEAPPSADFFQDPAGKHIANSAPFFYFQADHSFELTTRLHVDMQHIYDSGCLMLMSDELNWAKLCFEFNGKHPTIVSVVTRDGSSDDCNSERVTCERPYLRITKAGKLITFAYSEDAVEWKLIRYFGMNFPTPLMAGVVAQSPKGTGTRVQFDYLQVATPDAEERF
ncbi:hypothetical protein FHS18_003797 [Paenibacillus phyllosphaerae]|uniref:DUF1349 domain-containing protein n=1 Tax=Paenibacillus phyllosphaerae TaxID=274593 RepID=A0A7W5B099_9BACL|nr:DUF1349 domain-containing protein [Paenibacillus phyllosphaerae]MBB3111729.1 hypothetical protein [Paenibacillus phyllosphaerae]